MVQQITFLNVNDRYDPPEALPFPPVWELEGHGTTTSVPGGYETPPPWFNVRLTFADGTRIDVLAVVNDGRIAIEDMRADPPLSLDGFAVLGERIEDPLEDACGVAVAQSWPVEPVPVPAEPCAPGPGPGREEARPGRHRARSSVPRGSAGRRMAAEAYRAAQQEGSDPVLAVMCATGRSRRKSLRLIAGARDEGYLAPRHNRR